MPGPCGPGSMPTQPLEVRLSVMVSDSPDSFILNLSYSRIPIKTLLDSGATHCFIDSSFVSDHRLPVCTLPHPLRLHLFDGSYSPDPITYEVTIPILFDVAHTILVTFLVTPLDPDISAVLGISWLCQHNPSVNWVTSCIHFPSPDLLFPSSPVVSPSVSSTPALATPASLASTGLATPLQLPVSSTPIATPTSSASPASLATPTPLASPTGAQPVHVSFVNATAFWMHTQHIEQSSVLQIKPSDPEAFLRGAKVSLSAATPTSDPLNSQEFESLCNQIPPEYHDFLDVFSKSKADKLPNHNPAYNHHINLKEGKQPPFGPIYSLSKVESAALQDFLQENLARNFICPSQSACGAPMLFVKKKDGSLQLCINWCGLNSITKKD